MAYKREEMLAGIEAYDLTVLATDLMNGEIAYASDILEGNGWKQYSELTDDQVVEEFDEGEYEDERKQEQIRESPLAENEYFKELAGIYFAALKRELKADDPLENS